MTHPAPNDRGAVHPAQNDAEFPDDERGITGTRDEARAAAAARAEGPTAPRVLPPRQRAPAAAHAALREDNGVPDVSQDDFPTMQGSEDPEFAPEPGDRESHRTAGFGTTA